MRNHKYVLALLAISALVACSNSGDETGIDTTDISVGASDDTPDAAAEDTIDALTDADGTDADDSSDNDTKAPTDVTLPEPDTTPQPTCVPGTIEITVDEKPADGACLEAS